MAITIYNIKKWTKMLTGRSIYHVSQGIGKVYSKNKVKGYYNDLTEKVINDKNNEKVKLPTVKTEDGKEVLIPITIFQYGLGAYDLYLLHTEKLYLDKFKNCVNWAIANQDSDGSWNNFFYKQPEAPYSSMAQGEGISLLIRAYVEFKDSKYLIAAKNAMDFMLKPIEEGGTTEYIKDEVYLKELTNKPVILNGWIFSIFGLYDYLLVDNQKEIRKVYNKTLNTLALKLNEFDIGYWSKYDNQDMLCSPFYHKLHIVQLEALYDLTNMEIFESYASKWEQYEKSRVHKTRAFLVKAYQKITE